MIDVYQFPICKNRLRAESVTTFVLLGKWSTRRRIIAWNNISFSNLLMFDFLSCVTIWSIDGTDHRMSSVRTCAKSHHFDVYLVQSVAFGFVWVYMLFPLHSLKKCQHSSDRHFKALKCWLIDECLLWYSSHYFFTEGNHIICCFSFSNSGREQGKIHIMECVYPYNGKYKNKNIMEREYGHSHFCLERPTC